MIVTVMKAALLQILHDNRKKHRAIFEEAQVEYRKEVIAALDKALEDAKAGRKIKSIIRFDAPMDMTSAYDTAIGMLEMATNETIQLDADSYNQFVLDKWEWSGQFVTANAKYSKTLGVED